MASRLEQSFAHCTTKKRRSTALCELRAISHICQVSKIMLKILLNRMSKNRMNKWRLFTSRSHIQSTDSAQAMSGDATGSLRLLRWLPQSIWRCKVWSTLGGYAGHGGFSNSGFESHADIVQWPAIGRATRMWSLRMVHNAERGYDKDASHHRSSSISTQKPLRVRCW